MADDKKYYYMRLKNDYFDGVDQKLLESMTDGYLYSNILLKLYLRSLSRNGLLMVTDYIPYNAEMIAAVTGHQVGTVEKALLIFEDMGLIEKLDNGAIYMLNIQNYIGSASTEADRRRAQRNEIEAEKERLKISSKRSGQMSDKCLPEIRDRDRDIDKDRDKERERVFCAEPPESGRSAPKTTSEFNLSLNDNSEYNVPLEDVEKYKTLYRNVDVEQQLRNMEGWLMGNPNQRKTRSGIKRFIVNWLSKEQNKGNSSFSSAQPKSITKGDMNYTQHDYSSSDYDWLKGGKNDDLMKYYGDGM